MTALACAADAAIDVHTAGNCIPYILLDPVKDVALSQATDALAHATGITTIGEFTSERYESTGLAASLPPAVHAAGKPAFTLELAGSGNVAWEQAEAGAIGLRNAIRHTGNRRTTRARPSTACPCTRRTGTDGARCSPSVAASSSLRCARATTSRAASASAACATCGDASSRRSSPRRTAS